MSVAVTLSQPEIDAILERVKKEVFNSAKVAATEEIHRYIRGGQFIGELRNLITKEAVAELKISALKKLDDQKVLETALLNAEKRINQYIHTKLKDGIVVSFNTPVS